MSVEQFGYKQELHRALTFRDLLVYGMIFMVPMASLATSGTARRAWWRWPISSVWWRCSLPP